MRRANWGIQRRLLLMIAFQLLVSFSGVAQLQITTTAKSDPVLPDAPDPQQANSSGSLKVGAISGTVLDASGAVVPSAHVRLLNNYGSAVQTRESEPDGQFVFHNVPAGSYFVTVDALGFAPLKTKEITIIEEQHYLIPEILLNIADVTASVLVRPTEEIAAEQIRAEEKQRMLGVFPNFYVSYVPDAAPLTSRQKLSLAMHDSFDWTSYVGISTGAGIEQASGAFKGYGQGAAGYGKRWGALFVDGHSSDLLSHYVFASLLHQDPRYFYQGTGTTRSRVYHALSSAFIARSDSGKSMPNYSYLLGDLCSAGISNAYYPSEDRGVGLVFTNAAIGIAGRAGQALLQEFVGKRLTKNVPASGSLGGQDPITQTSAAPLPPVGR